MLKKVKRSHIWNILMVAVLLYGAYVAWDLWQVVYTRGM